jgi:hypothetical protein
MNMVRKCFARIALVAISMTVGIIFYIHKNSGIISWKSCRQQQPHTDRPEPIGRVVTVLDSIAIKAPSAYDE